VFHRIFDGGVLWQCGDGLGDVLLGDVLLGDGGGRGGTGRRGQATTGGVGPEIEFVSRKVAVHLAAVKAPHERDVVPLYR
jgi:hypothetical protein